MAFKFFTVPVGDGGQAEAELNAFLRARKVLAVDRRWVEQGAASLWCFCVDFLEGSPAGGGPGLRGPGPRAKVDYKEVLTPQQFAVFARLRDLRKEIAQAEAVPVYTVFTNEQLAAMVQQKASTRAALEKVAGVGDARVEKYGPRVLAVLAAAWPADGHEARRQPVRDDSRP
jgi:superfamily II DNA helicase RecQ